jgi:hypothetical protein
MDNILDTYAHPKLDQDGTNHLNRSIRSSEIEAATKNLPKKKITGNNGFSGEFYQTIKKELIQTPLKLFHELGREECCQTHSMKPVLHLSQH